MSMTNLMLAAYPVGSIYMSVNATSPQTLFGGTWERITGKFLLAATDNGNSGASQAAGNTGGEATHQLTQSETPIVSHSHFMSHTHTINHGHGHTNPTVTLPNHVHSMGHTHGLNSGNSRYVGYNYSEISTGVGVVRVAAATSGTNYVPKVANSKVDFSGSANTAGSSAANTGNPTSLPNCSVSGGGVTNHTGSSGGSSAANTGGVDPAKNLGSAHNNMPPYLAVYVWKRTA